MRRAVALLLSLTLAGCLPDRAKDLAECQQEASRFYETYRAVDPDDPSSRYLIGCMAAKGYVFSIAAQDCRSERPFPNQAACYRPDSWLGWIAEQFGGG